MTAMLTPYDSGTARRAGRHLWRKQILPLGTIDYKGRTITFDRDYLAGLAAAFDAAAFDQVPFQLADAANAHTNDPERYRGEVEAFQVTGDGLDVIVSATDDGSAILAANPRLGISARIVEDYQRADGQRFPAAIQHVLGTLDPRITGMRPWQAIDAAADRGDAIDLTGLAYAPLPAPPPAQEETGMSLTAEQEQRLGQLLDLPEDRFTAILAGPPDDPGELTDEELRALLDSLPDDDATAVHDPAGQAQPQPDSAPAKPETPAPPSAGTPAQQPAAAAAAAAQAPAEMSVPADAQAAIDLANARAAEQEIALARMQAQLDAAGYEKERDAYARQHGIPPRIFDLARPLLEGTGRVIELSGGKTADAGAIVRQVLREIGQTARLLDLSAETGDPAGADTDTAREQQAAAERGAVIRGFRAMTGV